MTCCRAVFFLRAPLSRAVVCAVRSSSACAPASLIAARCDGGGGAVRRAERGLFSLAVLVRSALRYAAARCGGRAGRRARCATVRAS